MLSPVSFPFRHILLHPGPARVLETQWLGYVRSADSRAAIGQAPGRRPGVGSGLAVPVGSERGLH